MKKALALLLSGLFLYGCGMGGGGTTASSSGTTAGGSQSGPNAQSGPAQVFTLNLVDGAKVAARTIAGASQTATNVRVVIRQYAKVPTPVPNFDENGDFDGTTTIVDIPKEVYKDIQDVAYSTTGSVVVGIPAGTGYTIDVITSILEGSNYSIIKYGQGTDIQVNAGGSASITINDLNTILAFTFDDPVVSKGKLDVTLNNALPLEPRYRMVMHFGNISTVATQMTTKCTFTAPTVYAADTNKTVELKGQFTLNKSFLKQGESQAKWTRTFPNAAYQELGTIQVSPLLDVTVPVN